ncbi:TIGR03862 family flavoprotein [Marivita sp.]|uniref:TIGR03862 family flavoprotein n=1 Tax=Marivita sp. TaxID=2003365 RepID=UPI0025B9375A|nr:TIGR03862 family flavoprotein [Marivita sp.]
MTDALVIGGGPAGLMAAEALLSAGRVVTLVEAKPSIGRKFLMAGKSGLNLTRMQPFGPFLASYGAGLHPTLRACLKGFGPQEVRAWAENLGQTTFAGSTGRLFPHAMKASPLLRAWLERLDGLGLERHTRWRWVDWDQNTYRFDTPEGTRVLTPRVTVFALGGASWARLGSDGHWADRFAANGITVTPFQPSNVGLRVDWSGHMTTQFGQPIKSVEWRAGDLRSRGEAILSKEGLEGGGIYSLAPALREDGAPLTVDLLPDLSVKEVQKRLPDTAKKGMAKILRNTLNLPPVKIALWNEFTQGAPVPFDELATRLKALPIRHSGLRPMDEAISTAGGVAFEALDDNLMLKDRPGTFCAGEMLDWDAPTGGYLLTACFATGLWAGRHAAEYDRP